MSSLIHITAIERVRYDKLKQQRIKHILEWNKNKRCPCVQHILNPSIEEFIACPHSEADFINKNYKKIKKGFKDTLILGKFELLSDLHYSSKRF